MRRPGEQRGDEITIRCPFCGDSVKRDYVGHCSVNVRKRVYYCVRCGQGGHVSDLKHRGTFPVISLDQRGPDEIHKVREWHDLIYHLIPGQALSRATLLDRFHLPGGSTDVFPMRTPSGLTTGFHIRNEQGRRTFGKRGLGFVGTSMSELGNRRIVEGPYDVQYPEDLCLFGLMPSKTQRRFLSLFNLILCPDGDIWARQTILARYMKQFERSRIIGIERLPDGKDPDEVVIERREWLGKTEMEELFDGFSQRRVLSRPLDRVAW